MTTIQARATRPAARQSVTPTGAVRLPAPASVFASFGVACALLTLFCWVRWAAGGHAHAVIAPAGQPQWRVVTVHAGEAILVLATIVMLWRLVVRPLRRDRVLSRDGLFALAFLALYMLQDPWVNYAYPAFHFNPIAVNAGCPQCYVPGFHSSHAMGEPLLLIWGMYVPILFGVSLLVGRLMGWSHARWPRMGFGRLYLIGAAAITVADLAVELPMLHLGLMGYPGVKASAAMFGGHSYQYPWFEFLWPLTWAGFAALRFFVDAHGATFAERGANLVPPQRRTLVRFLAIFGALQAIYLVYSVSATLFVLQGSSA